MIALGERCSAVTRDTLAQRNRCQGIAAVFESYVARRYSTILPGYLRRERDRLTHG